MECYPLPTPSFYPPLSQLPFFSVQIMERTGVTIAQWSHCVERLMPQPSSQNWPAVHCTAVSKQQTFISITFCHRIWMLHTLTNTDYLFLPPRSCCSEKAMAPHFSTLAWKIPWTEEPGRLQSMGSHRVRHDWSDLAAVATISSHLEDWNNLKLTFAHALSLSSNLFLKQKFDKYVSLLNIFNGFPKFIW